MEREPTTGVKVQQTINPGTLRTPGGSEFCPQVIAADGTVLTYHPEGWYSAEDDLANARITERSAEALGLALKQPLRAVGGGSRQATAQSDFPTGGQQQGQAPERGGMLPRGNVRSVLQSGNY